MMQNFDKCRSYAEVVKSFDKCGIMHDHVYSHNISDREHIYEIHTTNHVDHSYSYSSPTENPDVNATEKIQHEHDYYQIKIESVEISKSPIQILFITKRHTKIKYWFLFQSNFIC